MPFRPPPPIIHIRQSKLQSSQNFISNKHPWCTATETSGAAKHPRCLSHDAAGQDAALAVVAAPAGFRDWWLDGDVDWFVVVCHRRSGGGGE